MNRDLLRRLAAFYLNGAFAKFLMAGGLAAAANFLSRLAAQSALGFTPAVVLGYAVGFTTAFLLNRRFVFPASGKPMRQEIAWFFVFNAVAFPVVVAAAVILRDHVFEHLLPEVLAENVAHGCAIMIPIVFNFAAHRLVTFGPARSRG